ncbi:hypothetical protein P7K49_014664 [Saguinus oedipus]|uniref:Secreted protein n=1 Tax=Saguinus oedipus TaxID=9490 RepID=A0ABQ9V7V3_SAGOE|nr:hypothetical protein P7K49_014664 [Saguinus oedipus]
MSCCGLVAAAVRCSAPGDGGTLSKGHAVVFCLLPAVTAAAETSQNPEICGFFSTLEEVRKVKGQEELQEVSPCPSQAQSLLLPFPFLASSPGLHCARRLTRFLDAHFLFLEPGTLL